ncbi:MAG: DciA family protein [Pseudomonadota bacterium]
MLKTKKSEEELLELFRTRQNDRKKLRTKKTNSRVRKPEKASDLLKQFFKDEPDALKKMHESRALESWRRYVGKEAEQVSKAVRIKEGELLVVVSDPLWLHQLLLLKNQILNCYRKDFPQLRLKQIFFKRGELS